VVTVAQQDLQPAGLGQGVEDRPPVHPGGLYRHMRDLIGDQPAGHLA
jgi:hypothetical protein